MALTRRWPKLSFLVVVGVLLWTHNYFFFPWYEKNILDKGQTKFVAFMQEQLPINLSDKIKITSLRREHNLIVYTVQFDLPKDELVTLSFRSSFIKRVADTVCKTSTQRNLVNRGVKFKYEYVSGAGHPITSIEISACPEPEHSI